MSLVNSSNMVQFSAGLSILKSANRQPELALELLVKSLEGASAPARTADRGVPVSVAPQGTGQILDIIA